mgnify:CR=1 FL=1
MVAVPTKTAVLHAGLPAAWTLHITDDWGLKEYSFAFTPSLRLGQCNPGWTEFGPWGALGRTTVDTVVSTAFPSEGPYCVALRAEDDVGNNVGAVIDVTVFP